MADNLGNPFKIVVKILRRIGSSYHAAAISSKRNVNTAGKLRVYGKPLVEIKDGCKLYLGDNVVLNSRNEGYHVNMFGPVKLFADRTGAEIRIGSNTRIHGTCIHAYSSITIGDNCLIAANCQIFDGNGHDLSFDDPSNRLNTEGTSEPVVIGNSVWIGSGAVIMPGVQIGEGAVISANSVVGKSVPPMVVVGGNPAVIVKTLLD